MNHLISRKSVFVFLAVSCLSFGGFGARRGKAIELGPKATQGLDRVLKQASDLHGALVAGEPGQVVSRAQSLKGALGAALAAEDSNHEAKKHLNLILAEARKSLERYMSADSSEKKPLLQSVFQQLVLVGQTYRSTVAVKFYFCRSDRSVWLQSNGKPKNPINPEKWGNCGTQVQ